VIAYGSSTSSSAAAAALAKEPSLSHSLPYKILPDLPVPV
jgi:hypothetical protein